MFFFGPPISSNAKVKGVDMNVDCMHLLNSILTRIWHNKKIYKCVYLSLLIISKLFLKCKSLIIFRLDKLMDAIEKKPIPPRLSIQLKKFNLQFVPVLFLTSYELEKVDSLTW